MIRYGLLRLFMDDEATEGSPRITFLIGTIPRIFCGMLHWHADLSGGYRLSCNDQLLVVVSKKRRL